MNSSGKHLVLYDDECPMCTFGMKVITWLDWLNVAALIPLASDQAREAVPHLDRETLRAAMHVVTSRGKTYSGARGFRFLALRMPLVFGFGLLMWLPGVIVLAEWVYKHLATNRYLLSKIFGCKDACAVMPVRKREHDNLT